MQHELWFAPIDLARELFPRYVSLPYVVTPMLRNTVVCNCWEIVAIGLQNQTTKDQQYKQQYVIMYCTDDT